MVAFESQAKDEKMEEAITRWDGRFFPISFSEVLPRKGRVAVENSRLGREGHPVRPKEKLMAPRLGPAIIGTCL